MNKNYIVIILLVLGFVFSIPLNAKTELPNGDTFLNTHSTPVKDSLVNNTLGDSLKTKNATASPIVYAAEPITTLAGNNSQPSGQFEGASGRTFPTLDQKLSNNKAFNIPLAHNKPEFTSEFIAAHFSKNPKVDQLIEQAKKAFNELKKLQNFAEIITGKELLELPVGLRKKDSTSQNTVELAIVEVKFTPKYAEFKAWAKLTIPQKGPNGEPERELYFGAEGIKLSHDGALINGMKLVLLGDAAIPLNGDQWLLTLKGGIDLNTGTFSEQTFVEFDCSGLKQIGLEADLRISREVLLPIDDNGDYVCPITKETKALKDQDKDQVVGNKCYVGASFSINANGWNDILYELTLPKFEVVGLKGWGFNIDRAVLDLSDSRSSDSFELPQSYENLYTASNKKLWRGFYAKEISVMLPKGIEKTNQPEKRVSFKAENLIIDSQGVSGKFSGENILNLGEGSVGKWAFTVEDVSLTLDMNTVTDGSIGGDITVPIIEGPMEYDGYVSAAGWGLEVGLTSENDVPLFLAEMTLAPNSSVGINVLEDKVYPYANLTGQLSILGKINQKENEAPPSKEAVASDSKGFSFPNITFQELKLETKPGEKPISSRAFGFDGDINLMGFPATISNLKLVTPEKLVGLAFDLKINLDKEGSHATSKMNILGKLEADTSIEKWKFSKVKIDGVQIDYSKSGFAIAGELNVMEDDPIYGDGFSGSLKATFEKLNFSAEGKAMFGKKDFRYWFVDIWTDKTTNTGTSKLPIKAFVGGVSNRMRKVSGNTDGFSPGSAKYEPDEKLGLGVRAGVKIETANSGTFSGKAYLEMDFNTSGGINRIGFMGEGAFMGDDKGFQAESQNEAIGKVFGKVNDFIEKNKEKADQLSEYGNFLGLSQEAIPVRDVASTGAIGVYVGIEKDFENGTFDGEFELYMDLSGIKGGGADNLAGYAKIHTGPKDWYLYLGTPQKRIELIFNAGTQIRVGGYFMTGTVLPSQLDPHPTVVKILGDDMLNGNRKENQLNSGKGFAFGLNFGYGYGFDWKLFYAFVEVGAGFDVMHAYYPNAKCVGRPGPIGNNGWYSMGQVYAYIYGEFGVKVDLAFIKGNFVIAEAGIAAMLRGQFPNPVYIQGYAGMYYSILGGLVEGRMRLKMEIGEKCELENISNAVGVPIISDLSPNDKSDDVSVFAAPQAVLNYAANKDFTVDVEGVEKTFKLRLKSFNVTSEGKTLKGELEWNDTNDAVTFKPAETLPSEKKVKVVVEISFDEKVGGSYTTLIQNGKPAVEKAESEFMTDKAPDYIPIENIAYMYPVLDQQSFYPEEYNKGYIKMKTPQHYLFENEYEMRAEFVSTNTARALRTNLSYDREKAIIFYDIPKMELNNKYEINLLAFPPGADIQSEITIEKTNVLSEEDEAVDTNWYNVDSDSQAKNTVSTTGSAVVSNKKAANISISQGAPKPILNYNFKTSKHASFKDKVRDLNVTNNLTNFIAANVHSLSIKVSEYEYLSKLEILGNKYTAQEPLVYAQAILDDAYYKQQIYGLLYENYPLDGDIRVNRDENVLGLPPIRSFYIGYEYLANIDDNPNSSWVKNRIPFVYNLPYQYKSDMSYLRNKIANRYSFSGGDKIKYEQYKYLIHRAFPALPLGKFKAQLIYTTPGKIYQKGYEIKYRND
ncbi:hypothetical protein [Pseudotamlana agarivorans]|uniref:hypothetical protein n=1 Tax=Pseudotamlana agarivorans TaxID=481183 RepID=UPI000A755842|nr:hypothetical protein [Tamlana agarivorans]